MTTPCHGCLGAGIDTIVETYAGVSEYIRCHECSPGCPRDCGCWVGVGPKSAWTAVPRLLAEREALRAEVDRLLGQARVEDVIYHEQAVRAEIAAERDRARDFAVQLEAENALLSEGVERLSSKIYKLRREAMDDLMALDRVLYAKACELFDNPKEAE